MYNSYIGRFLQTDPIGYEDDMNLYAYVGNNPIILIDPKGLCARTPESYGINSNSFSNNTWSNLASTPSRPYWKEFTDIFEFNFGTRIGLELKPKILGLEGQIGGGWGDVALSLEQSQFTSYKSASFGFAVGTKNNKAGLAWNKTTPIESGTGRPLNDASSSSWTFGLKHTTKNRRDIEATPWKIGTDATIGIVQVGVGINLKELYEFMFHPKTQKAAKTISEIYHN